MAKALVNRVIKLERTPGKGGWTYVIIDEIAPDKRAHFGLVQVKGKIDHYDLKSYKLMPMGNGKLFLPVKAEIRKRIGKEAGDTVKVVLYADNDPVTLPQELLECLRDEPVAYERFLKSSEGSQKSAIDYIYAAKKQETRSERIALLIKDLLNGRSK
ncbi:MAG: DUF1905 domain-containing protein [Chitinophagaceae bacterium]|nr:DUF1905 domain-containing protein [Chitinophagaceae bacterium]